jgi:Uma2 family endonuclease
MYRWPAATARVSSVRVAARAQIELDEVYRHSLDEYHRLIEAGGFDDRERVELLDGLLVRMSPKTPRHERAVRWLASWLIRALDGDRYTVGIAGPLTIGSSEPEPDLAVIECGTPEPYHPAGAALVIEVAVSSLSRDLGVKTALYAAAAIPEYWVLDLAGRRLVVHRAPDGDHYAQRFEADATATVSAEALPLPPMVMAELLAAAGN